MHHSDRGIHYCSHEHQNIHVVKAITSSVADDSDCYQNALVERINGILKQELLLEKPLELKQAQIIITESIEACNSLGPHLPF